MARVAVAIAATVLACLFLGSIATTTVQIDREKLKQVADSVGVTSFLETQAQEEPSVAAVPGDLESGNFEIKCSTSCAFVKAGGLMKSATGGGGEAAIKAAEKLAKSQEELKKITDALAEDPNNAGLQGHQLALQTEVNERTAALQAAVSGTTPNVDLEGTAVALAQAERKLEQLETQRKTAPGPELDAEIDLAKAQVVKLKATVNGQKDKDGSGAKEVEELQERLTQLKAALAKAPGDATVKEQLEAVQKALDEKSKDANSFTPAQECYRVCMNSPAPKIPAGAAPGGRRLLAEDMAFAGDVNNCMRMCVKVMRNLVYNMAQKFL